MTMPPGWQPDAYGQPVEHYWDGRQWTGQTRPIPNPTSPGMPGYQTTPLPVLPSGRPVHPPWYLRKGFMIPAAIVGGLFVIGAIGSAIGPKTTPASSTSSHSDSSAAPPISSAAQPAPAHSTATVERSVPSTVTSSAPPAGEGDFVMPNEVGNVLQSAQDDIQRVSGDPIFFSHSHDLLGDRFQVLDSNWKVCNQNVPAGTKVGPTAHIDFGVVKLEETCP